MLTVDTNASNTDQPPETNDDQVIHKLPPSYEFINTQSLQEVAIECPTYNSITQIDLNRQRNYVIRDQSSQIDLDTNIGYEKHERAYIVWWIITIVTGFCFFVGIPCLILLYIVKRRKHAGNYDDAQRAWSWCMQLNWGVIAFTSALIVMFGLFEVMNQLANCFD